MSIDHIYTLHRNPFTMAPVIQSFYQNWDSIEKDILLSYLILPLVTFEPMRAYLKAAKSNSSIRTMASDSSRLLGLSLRIEEFKPITNAALLILNAEKRVQIDSNLCVRPLLKPHAINADPKIMRCAEKLSIILAGETVVSIYRMLGLKSL